MKITTQNYDQQTDTFTMMTMADGDHVQVRAKLSDDDNPRDKVAMKELVRSRLQAALKALDT